MTDTLEYVETATQAKKKARISVTAAPSPIEPWVKFSMSADFPDAGGKQDKEKLEFDANAGEFDVEFTLHDKTKLNLQFYPDFNDAFWAQVGIVCPVPQAGNGNGAITHGSVSKNTLSMTNLNAVGETLSFMLRFTGNKTGIKFPPYEYDPQIVNGGGVPEA